MILDCREIGNHINLYMYEAEEFLVMLNTFHKPDLKCNKSLENQALFPKAFHYVACCN